MYYSDTDGNPLNLQASELSGDVFTVFGESPISLENTLQKSFQIEIIDVLDDAQINITGLTYDTVGQQFSVTIENTGRVDAYVSTELVDLIVNDEEGSYGSDGIVKVEAGDEAHIPVSVEMTEADLAANPTVRVRAYYGERELSRIKITEAEFPIELRSNYTQYVVYTAIIVLILLFLFFLGTKKKCKACGHKNARGRKTCIHCGHKF